MFLETVGKLFFSKMRPSLFYFFLALPPLLSCAYLFIENDQVREQERLFSQSCKKGKGALQKKGAKEALFHRHANPSPYFLAEKIESLSFLEKEKKELEELEHHPAIAQKEQITERLSFLKSDQNRLRFREEALRSTSRIKEREEVQIHPIEMNEEDLKHLLSLLEDIPIGPFTPLEKSPQIILTDFHFQKKISEIKTTVLEVDMKLLTREFSQ